MGTHNPDNERVKRAYFTYLKEAQRKSEQTIDSVAQALARFEGYTRHRDFKAFHIEQAIGFKRSLSAMVAGRSGKRLAIATQHGTLIHLRAFFRWLAREPGYKSRIHYADADYFNLSEKEARVATARREAATPTLEQVRHVLSRMPFETDLELRNRAVVAFVLLTGARDGAVASFKLRHLNLLDGYAEQDAREVKTKASKTFTTWFFPVGDEVRAIVEDWVAHLRNDSLWSEDDPLFPATQVGLDQGRRFAAQGLARKHWSGASAIRGIFKAACANAGLPYFHPHSIRRTLAQLGQRVCKTPEQYKAWSQNLGHEDVLTTFNSYGTVSRGRQSEIMRELGAVQEDNASPLDELAEVLLRRMKEADSRRS